MKIGEYLINAVRDAGVRHVFGIQGDYVLDFYGRLYNSPLKVVNTCTEQGAGFAADAYARMTGFGAVCVTYGVGGLNIANTTAQAYAERSPVLVISGAPGVSERRHDPLLHHKIRSFRTQLNIFREMTAAQAVLENADTAGNEIDRVIGRVIDTKRPGYIELPRDMVCADTYRRVVPAAPQAPLDQSFIDQACKKAMEMISRSKRPVIIAGVEVHRFGLQEMLLKFIEASGLPFVTGVLGKSVIAENHPQFVGVYAGAMSPDWVREAVEGSDCVIAIGPLVTDLATGIFSQHVDPEKSIVSSPDGLVIGSDSYPGIGMEEFLGVVTLLPQSSHRFRVKEEKVHPFLPESGKAIKVERLIMQLNAFLNDDTVVIADAGDAFLAGLDLRVHGGSEFLSCAYYASLGFAVPASIGVQLADSRKRPLVLAGDGSFQMSAMELSTSVRNSLNPIVVVFDNGGYGTFRPILDGPFNDIQPWRYTDIVNVIGGGEAHAVSTEDGLSAALASAKKNRSSPSIIAVKLDRHDISARMRILTEKIRGRVRQGPGA
jgi:indolepyruvate decarboxylase